MAVAYSVMASVVDIKTDTPKPDDVFFVDSNVWYWLTYSRHGLSAPPPSPHQLRNYPQYLAKAYAAKAKLLRCGLSLSELAHLIEKTEREIYNRTNQTVLPKEYRHNLPNERQKVVAEIQSAWAQVKSIAGTIDVNVNDASTDTALTDFSTLPVDAYDLFMINAIQTAGIVKVITDDGDYSSVPGIQIFTSNPAVLNAARLQGKLVIR